MQSLIFAGFLLVTVAEATVPLQQPTFSQVAPDVSCTNGATLIAASSTGINGGYLVGKAHVNNFPCRPRIGYTHFYSACANMVWDFNGAIVSVTPTAFSTRPIAVCP